MESNKLSCSRTTYINLNLDSSLMTEEIIYMNKLGLVDPDLFVISTKVL